MVQGEIGYQWVVTSWESWGFGALTGASRPFVRINNFLVFAEHVDPFLPFVWMESTG
jgi:hypothetical protein